MRKIVFVTDIPTYHKIPLLNKLYGMLSDINISLGVVFLLSSEKRRMWKITLNDSKFKYVILSEPKVNITYEWTLTLPVRLVKHLLASKPDLIIIGGFSIATIALCILSHFTRIKYVIWSGEVNFSQTSQTGWRRFLRQYLLKKTQCAIAYGSEARNYLIKIVPELHVFTAYNTSDVNHLRYRVLAAKDKLNDPNSSLFLYRDCFNILFVGGLVKRKGVDILIKCLPLLAKVNNYHLHIVGDGVEKAALQNLAQELNVVRKISFWGYKNKDDLINYYAMADVFILPTCLDIWGLVINEAMAAGLPVLASKYAGATYDLVDDDINGFAIDPYDRLSIANKIIYLANNPNKCQKMGDKAREKINSHFTPEKTAQEFLKAILYALS